MNLLFPASEIKECTVADVSAYSYVRLLHEPLFVLCTRKAIVFHRISCSLNILYTIARSSFSYYICISNLASLLTFFFQIQHPRSDLNRFDLVITPRHDYYPLTPQAQKQVPRFLRRWITPREPPDQHVVCIRMLYCSTCFPIVMKLFP